MVLIHVGVTSVIAHIKIGQMHAALESKVLVVSAQGQSAATQRVFYSHKSTTVEKINVCEV